MIRLPPISTRTDTLFPNTTLFRSPRIVEAVATPGGATLDLRVEDPPPAKWRSEEHTSELQSLMRISYAVFCLKKKKIKQDNIKTENKKYKQEIKKSPESSGTAI